MNIVTENLGKRFNREWIFKKLNYTFEQGTCYAITGPNGSGKSTLMQVLWGQVPQSQGQLSYTSTSNGAIPIDECHQHLSIATPYMELIEEFTLEEMVNFHFKFKTTLNNESADEIITRMALDHARKKQVSNFSSGMKQRLKLGLAFFSKTAALFLDEPTSNLDKKAIEWYQVNLRAVARERLVLIASNVDYEYPDEAKKLDLLDYK
ncbi:MAG: ATP-binding cassette domain-containing protein [Cyclobacteriaceae bacterium]|nr:ATP-binding cassette domain-containing protein [Cyclobacteriaceae bacterium]